MFSILQGEGRLLRWRIAENCRLPGGANTVRPQFPAEVPLSPRVPAPAYAPAYASAYASAPASSAKLES